MRDRNVRELTRSSSSNFFIFEAGLYMIPSDLVKLDQKGIPRLMYFEGNPTPIGKGQLIKKAGKEEAKGDRSGEFLDDMISRNFLDQIDARATAPRDWFGWMKNLTPEVVVFLVLALAVLFAFIQGGFKV